MPIESAEMEEEARQEIAELHIVLEDWLAGKSERSERVFSRFSDALDPGFRIVSPRGAVTGKQALTRELWGAHGAAGDAFEIEIRNAEAVVTADDLVVVTYEEWQRGRGEPTARIATAIFGRDPKDGGLRWLYLHETWLRM